MAPPMDVVLAGTKPFALALFAPLTERTGSRPRIAPDPAQALALCGASSGLLVVEYGAAWLPALAQLRQQAPGLRIVAALPRGQEGAALSLAPLGVEAVPWDGQPAPVVAAVERAAGAAGSQAPAPAPAVARPAPPTLVAPRPPPPAVAAPAPVRPPAPAAPPVAVPPVAVPPVAAPAPAAEPLDLFSDLGGTEATPVPGATPAVDPLVAAAARPSAPPPYTGPSAVEARSAAAWPSAVPSADEAEAALVLHLRGKLGPDAPLASLTRQAVAGMSELERQALGGAALPFDGGPIYRAAVLRLRVAAALATAPAPPARIDDAAVQRLLADLDAALAEVNPLAQGAPPEHRPVVEAVRNALVREAVDFSEAAHRATSAGPPPAEVQARPAPRAAAPAAKVLSVQAGAAVDDEEERRRRGPLVLLVLVVLAIAAVMGWQQASRPPVRPPRTYAGAPANTYAMKNGKNDVLVQVPGKSVDPAELERFRAAEKQKGNEVREIGPGQWLIAPAAAPQGAKP